VGETDRDPCVSFRDMLLYLYVRVGLSFRLATWGGDGGLSLHCSTCLGRFDDDGYM
jgi:hypothetical protein